MRIVLAALMIVLLLGFIIIVQPVTAVQVEPNAHSGLSKEQMQSTLNLIAVQKNVTSFCSASIQNRDEIIKKNEKNIATDIPPQYPRFLRTQSEQIFKLELAEGVSHLFNCTSGEIFRNPKDSTNRCATTSSGITALDAKVTRALEGKEVDDLNCSEKHLVTSAEGSKNCVPYCPPDRPLYASEFSATNELKAFKATYGFSDINLTNEILCKPCPKSKPIYNKELNQCVPKDCTLSDLKLNPLPDKCKTCEPGYKKKKDHTGKEVCTPTEELCKICQMKLDILEDFPVEESLNYNLIPECLPNREFESRIHEYIKQNMSLLNSKMNECLDLNESDLNYSDNISTICMNVPTRSLKDYIYSSVYENCDVYRALRDKVNSIKEKEKEKLKNFIQFFETYNLLRVLDYE